jgi:hypothetical protein
MLFLGPEDCGKFNEKMNIEHQTPNPSEADCKHRMLNGKDEETEIIIQDLTLDL